MSTKSPILQSKLISDLAQEDRDTAAKRLILSAVESQEVTDPDKLVREILPVPLSDLSGIPKSEVTSILEKSLQEAVETIAMEALEMGWSADYETCIELIYENPSDGDMFADEVIRNLRYTT